MTANTAARIGGFHFNLEEAERAVSDFGASQSKLYVAWKGRSTDLKALR